MNLKPLGDRVIVKRDEAETKTASGLYIASSAQEKPQTGIVLAVGEGKRDKDGNLILVKDLSRFGRNYIEFGQYTDYLFPSLGCRLKKTGSLFIILFSLQYFNQE